MDVAVVRGALFGKAGAFREFTLLTNIEALHRTVVTHHAGPNFTGLAFAVLEGSRFIDFVGHGLSPKCNEGQEVDTVFDHHR